MRFGPAILVVAGLVVLAAGCGGGSKPPAVASLGPTTSTTTTTSGGGVQSTGGKGLGNFVHFSDCMAAHGVALKVAQNGQGVSIGSNGSAGGPGPGSPQFLAAQKACQKYLPDGGPKQLTPAEEAQNMKTLLTMAKCLRAHGLPNFPDPSSQGVFQITPSSGLDPSSSQFQSAMQACRPANGARVAIGFRSGGPGGNSAVKVSGQ